MPRPVRPTRRTGAGHTQARVQRRPLADLIGALVVPEGASLVLVTPTIPTEAERAMVGDALAQAGLLGRCVMLVGEYGTGVIPTAQLLDIIQTPAVLADLRASIGEQTPADDAAAHYQGQPTIAIRCTPLTATWCPAHGDCVCPATVNTYGDLDRAALADPSCPLHAPDSSHGENAPTMPDHWTDLPVGEGNG